MRKLFCTIKRLTTLCLLCAFICTVFLTNTIQAQQTSTEKLELLVGEYTGHYSAGQGKTGLSLEVTKGLNGNYVATFSFYPLAENPNVPSGIYTMNASYDFNSNQYILVGNSWIKKPSGYDFANLYGNVENGVFSGVMNQDATMPFQLTKVAGEPQKAQAPQLDKLVGEYKGNYTANQGLMGLHLKVYKDPTNNYVADFNYYPDPKNPNTETGSYLMSVYYMEATQQYYLVGVQWINQSPTYTYVDLNGKLSGDTFSGNAAYGGTGNIFSVKKIATDTKTDTKIDPNKDTKSWTMNVTYNNKPIQFDQQPIIDSGRTMVPMRAVFEAMGATIHWDASTSTVVAVKEGKTIVLTVGDKNAIINGQKFPLDVAPAVYNGRTFVPLRFVAESLDCSVFWNEGTKTVEITN